MSYTKAISLYFGKNMNEYYLWNLDSIDFYIFLLFKYKDLNLYLFVDLFYISAVVFSPSPLSSPYPQPPLFSPPPSTFVWDRAGLP